MHFPLAPEHQVFSVDLGRLQTTILHLGHDARRLVLQVGIFAVIGFGQRGSVLRPGMQIGRGSNRRVVAFVIPLRVGDNVGAVLGFHHPWVFNPSGPFSRLLVVGCRVEHRRRLPLEMNAVFTHRESHARSVAADFHLAGIILSAIQHVNFSVTNYRARVERVQGFPVHRFLINWVLKDRILERADDRLSVRRTVKGDQGPSRVRISGAHRNRQSQYTCQRAACCRKADGPYKP